LNGISTTVAAGRHEARARKGEKPVVLVFGLKKEASARCAAIREPVARPHAAAPCPFRIVFAQNVIAAPVLPY
jgi:hypothetical protein